VINYIGKRLIALVPVLLVVSFITFILGSMSSGDTARMLAEKKYDKPTYEQVEQIRIEMGFDRPVLVQYADWLKNALHGDFGDSFASGNPVLEDILALFPKTLFLASLALVLLVTISFSLGILAAVFPNTWVDRLSRIYSFFSVSMPEFWLGLILLYIFGARLGLISVLGGSSMKIPFIPAITMAICGGGIYVRLVRTNMEEVLNKDYIRTARSKGLSEYTIITKHALKNALLPAVNKLGIGFGALLSGSAIIESIFSWNGLGKFALESVGLKDYPVVQGYVLFMAVLVVLINLSVDVICALIDPRLKRG
jgi:peptide/nickel transport system permease protein